VRAWINGGKIDGKEIIPEGYLREAMSSQMVVGANLPTAENPDAFFRQLRHGLVFIFLPGALPRRARRQYRRLQRKRRFFPSDSIGIVVLANQNGSRLPGLIRNYIADWMLQLPARDWHGQSKAALEKSKAAAEEAKTAKSEDRKQGARPSHLLAEFAGLYEHPGYGSILFSVRNDSLFAEGKELKMWAEHYHYNIFLPHPLKEGLNLGDENPFRFQFHTNLKGEIESVTFAGIEQSVEDIRFKKKAVEIAVSKEELEKYAGEYELGGVIAKVYLRGETLMVFVPGQPDYETVPIGNHEFKLKILEGYSVRFEMGEDSRAAAAYFVQPNGTFKASRKS
jgi:hypothetical protein